MSEQTASSLFLAILIFAFGLINIALYQTIGIWVLLVDFGLASAIGFISYFS